MLSPRLDLPAACDGPALQQGGATCRLLLIGTLSWPVLSSFLAWHSGKGTMCTVLVSQLVVVDVAQRA